MREAATSGMTEQEARMLKAVLDFNTTTAAQVMTPIEDVYMLEVNVCSSVTSRQSSIALS